MAGPTDTRAKPSETRGTEAGVRAWRGARMQSLLHPRRPRSAAPAAKTAQSRASPEHPTQNVGADLELPTLPSRQKDTETSKPHLPHSRRFGKRAFPPRGSGDRRARGGDRASRDIVSLAGARVLTLRFLRAPPGVAAGLPRGHLGSGPRARGFSGAINLKTQGSSPVSSAVALWRALAFSSVGTGTPSSCANNGTEVTGSG